MSIALQVVRLKKKVHAEIARECSIGLYGKKMYLQWNEPVWKRIAESFLNEFDGEESLQWDFGGETKVGDVGGLPAWDLDFPPDRFENGSLPEEKTLEETEEEGRGDTGFLDGKAPETQDNSPLSHSRDYEWAWFVPAHENTGIFGTWYSPSRTLGMVRILQEDCGVVDRVDAAELALFMGFWQCCSRGWIEALCSAAEAITGDDAFSPAMRRSKKGIPMENAISATLANGMAHFYYQSRDNKETLFNAMKTVYSQLGNGFEKHSVSSELEWWPTYRPLFQKNIFTLLTHREIYAIDQDLAKHVIGRFFEPSSFLFSSFDPEKTQAVPLGDIPGLRPLYFEEDYPVGIDGR